MIRRIVATIVGVVSVLSIASVVIPVSAQEATGSGNGLQISPTRTEITAEKGEKKSFSIRITNITQVDLTLDAVLNDFQSDGTSGVPQLIVGETERNAYSLDTILEGLGRITIPAGEVKDVEFSLDVPVDAVPGAYFGAIRYSIVSDGSGESAETRQVALNASVAHLVFLEVPGEINEQISVENVEIKRNDKASAVFFSTPNKSAVTVKNLGNGFSRPFGQVEISYWGKKVTGYDLNKSDVRGIILPQSSRTFTDDISGIKWPGKYSVVAAVAYGSGGEVVEYRTSFWYMPLWALGLLLLLILIVGGGATLVYRRRFASKKSR